MRAFRFASFLVNSIETHTNRETDCGASICIVTQSGHTKRVALFLQFLSFFRWKLNIQFSVSVPLPYSFYDLLCPSILSGCSICAREIDESCDAFQSPTRKLTCERNEERCRWRNGEREFINKYSLLFCRFISLSPFHSFAPSNHSISSQASGVSRFDYLVLHTLLGCGLVGWQCCVCLMQRTTE